MKKTLPLIAVLSALSTPVMAQDCDQLCASSFWLSATVDTLNAALASGLDPNASTAIGVMPLHKAASFGRPELAVILLEAGADISSADRFGGRPIHYVMAGSASAVSQNLPLLLSWGADINAKDFGGRSPILLAVRQPPEVLQMLIAAGADITAQDIEGNSVLHMAVMLGASQASIRFLLDAGANTSLLNTDNQTAIDLALAYGMLEIATLLGQ